MRKCKAATSSIERSVALATPTMSSAAKRSPRLATRPAELRRDALLDGGLHARVELLALAGYQHAGQCLGDRGRPVGQSLADVQRARSAAQEPARCALDEAAGCPAGRIAPRSRCRHEGEPEAHAFRQRSNGSIGPLLGKSTSNPGHRTRCPRGCRDTVGTCVECHARHGVCRYRS
jgi:hypothetical protein